MKANVDRIKRDLDIRLRSLEGTINDIYTVLVGLNQTIDKQSLEIEKLKGGKRGGGRRS